MKILAIDSSAITASVAVSDGDKIIKNEFVNNGLTHSQTLLPMIKSVLKKADLSLKDIDYFALTNGPGSFTGVRIGVCAIKGLAFAGDKKCIGVSTLEAIAFNLANEDCICVACMDARRNQIYTATFDCGEGQLNRLTADEAVAIESIAQRINSYNKKVYLAGDGAKLSYSILKQKCDNVYLPYDDKIYQNACSVCILAGRKINTAQESGKLVPSYLRLSQAQRELKKRRGEK